MTIIVLTMTVVAGEGSGVRADRGEVYREQQHTQNDQLQQNGAAQSRDGDDGAIPRYVITYFSLCFNLCYYMFQPTFQSMFCLCFSLCSFR